MGPVSKRARTAVGGGMAAAAIDVVEVIDSDDEPRPPSPQQQQQPQKEAPATAGPLVVVSAEEQRKEDRVALRTALAYEAVQQVRLLERCQQRLASLPERLEAQLLFEGSKKRGRQSKESDEVCDRNLP